MRALVVDDEPLARGRLTRMLEEIAGVEVVGQAEDGVAALEQVLTLGPDEVFLGIRVPGLGGLFLASREPDLPPLVFVAAYHEYAVQAFEAEAVDYLLKPVEEAVGGASIGERVHDGQPEPPPAGDIRLADQEVARLHQALAYTAITRRPSAMRRS